MIQYAPRLGHRLSRIAITPIMLVTIMARMRRLQAQTLRGISSALYLRPLPSFFLYVRSLISFVNFGVDYAIICAGGSDGIRRKMSEFDIRGETHFASALDTGRPILVVTMHMGDFQLGFLRLVERLRPRRQLSVFKLSDQNDNEDILLKTFASLGNEPIVMRAGDGGGRQAYLALRKGHIVAITIDLELNVTSRSTVQFFGRPCHMQNGPATLAALTRALIVPVINFTDSTHRRIVCVGVPIDAGVTAHGEDMPVTIQRLTQDLASCLESWIRIDPGQVQAWSAIAETMACPVPEANEAKVAIKCAD